MTSVSRSWRVFFYPASTPSLTSSTVSHSSERLQRRERNIGLSKTDALAEAKRLAGESSEFEVRGDLCGYVGEAGAAWLAPPPEREGGFPGHDDDA